jgi:hypothetical protein
MEQHTPQSVIRRDAWTLRTIGGYVWMVKMDPGFRGDG